MKRRKKSKRRTRDKTVRLNKPSCPSAYGKEGDDYSHWSRSLPFFRSSAGVLLHRVSSVLDFIKNGKVTHSAVHYLCNNTSFVRRGAEFVADPKADGRLVCTACERVAQQKRLPSADKIVGHHVHLGRLIAVQVCCCDHTGAEV